MCRIQWIQRIDAANAFKPLFLSQLLITSATRALVCQVKILISMQKSSLSGDNHYKVRFLHPSPYIKSSGQSKGYCRSCRGVTATIQDVHENTHHTEWFLTISKMLSQVGGEPSIQRRCGRQKHHSNVLADSPSEDHKHV